MQNEHWLGHENIFILILQGLYPRGNELRIDMMNAKRVKKFVRYGNFRITNAAARYILHVNDFTGALADSKIFVHNCILAAGGLMIVITLILMENTTLGVK